MTPFLWCFAFISQRLPSLPYNRVGFPFFHTLIPASQNHRRLLGIDFWLEDFLVLTQRRDYSLRFAHCFFFLCVCVSAFGISHVSSGDSDKWKCSICAKQLWEFPLRKSPEHRSVPVKNLCLTCFFSFLRLLPDCSCWWWNAMDVSVKSSCHSS